MNKNIIWHRLKSGIYQVKQRTDDSMVTLALFLEDGIGFEPYINFLENNEETEFAGNMSYLQKQGKMVTIEIDDYVFPELSSFTTTIDNLLIILKKYEKFQELEVDKIEIELDGDVLTISGG